MLKVCLAGATGHVGQELVKGIQAKSHLTLTACLGASTAGKRLPHVLPFECPDIVIDGSVHDALSNAGFDVLIDYTEPGAVFGTVMDAISNGIHCVIGTSGLSGEEYEKIHQAAVRRGVGVFVAGNFSITAALMMHFAEVAARYLPSWELIDYAPDKKPDAPSGTSRELAHRLAGVGVPRYVVAPEKVQGRPESRGVTIDGSQIHSVRVPGFYSSSEIMFGLPGERLTLRHDSISYAPYVAGTLLAAEEVPALVGLVRGIDTLLGLKSYR